MFRLSITNGWSVGEFGRTQMGGSLRILISLVLSFGMTEPAFAQTLSALEVFQRCYEKWIGFLPYDHPVLPSLRGQTANAGVEACRELLSRVEFDATGKLNVTGLSSLEASEASLLLQSMDDMHRSAFTGNDTFENVTALPCHQHTGELLNIYEASLFFTRAMFQPGVGVQSVFQESRAMESIRENGSDQTSSVPALSPMFQRASSQFIQAPIAFPTCFADGGQGPGCGQPLFPMSMSGNPFVMMGNLTGVQPLTAQTYPTSPNRFTLTAYPNGWSHPALEDSQAIPLVQPLVSGGVQGGGILSSRSFVALNWGLDQFILSDGQFRMPRRLTQTVFERFLCKSGVPARISDVRDFVDTANPTVPSFRKESTCIGCHMSYDWSAALYNHFELRGVHNGCEGSQSVDTVHLGRWKNDQGSMTPTQNPYWPWSQADTSYFHRRTPNARLFFRSIDSNIGLVNVPVTSLSDLGNKITQYPDFYICTASHYLNHLTGLHPDLSDDLDFFASSPSPEAIAIREFTIDAGMALMSDKNLKNLMGRILESPFFQSASFSPNGGQP